MFYKDKNNGLNSGSRRQSAASDFSFAAGDLNRRDINSDLKGSQGSKEQQSKKSGEVAGLGLQEGRFYKEEKDSETTSDDR